jgi:Tfp pilus assembly protein PilZ
MRQGNLDERRKFPRYEVSLFLKNFDSNSNLQRELEAHTKDISAQGIGLFTIQALPLGNSLDIYVCIPDNNEQIQVRGKVVWSSAVGPCKYRIGIELEKPELKPVSIVLRTLSQQIKTRYYYL